MFFSKMNQSGSTISLLSFITLVLFTFSLPVYAVVYVDLDAKGANDGTSWENAYSDITDAVEKSSDTVELWVAKGHYQANLQLKYNQELFGGFMRIPS